MRLRHQVTVAMVVVLGLATAASVATLVARSGQSRAAEAATAIRAHERGWQAVEKLLTANDRVAPRTGPEREPLARRAPDPHRLAANSQPAPVVMAVPREADRPAVSSMSAALLESAAAVAAAVPLLTDVDGRPLAAAAEGDKLARFADRLRGLDAGTVELTAGERTIAVATVPLRDASGEVVGGRRWLTDVTERSWTRDRDEALAAGGLLGTALLLGAGFMLWLGRAFAPLEQTLAAQGALADGDPTVDPPGHGREDEVGAATRALQMFRQGRTALRRRILADGRQQRMRLRLIEAQLGGLAAALEEPDRAGMEHDLRQVLAAAERDAGGAVHGSGMDALAMALRVLGERVRSQQQRLRQLADAQGDALAAQQRMATLEREFSAVTTMQSRSAALLMPGESGVAVAGQLLQGTQFGGGFQDCFWLDGAVDGSGVQTGGRRLAIVQASVHGAGLGAAFLAISARALVRSLAPQAVSPGECLAKLSDLLLRDNDDRMEIGAFLGIIDLEARTLVAARAAAPPPILLLRPGEARMLDVAVAPPLGLQPRLRVPDTTIDLPARATLVLASRGVVETVLGGAQLDLDGFATLLAASPGLDPDIVLAQAMRKLGAAGALRPEPTSILVARPSGSHPGADGNATVR